MLKQDLFSRRQNEGLTVSKRFGMLVESWGIIPKQKGVVHMEEYKLTTIYDSRVSFYGKANVIEADGVKTLRSYQTDVAYIKDGQAFVRGQYSMTTLRHVKEFLLQNGFQADEWSQIEKDYPYKEPTEQPESELGGHLKSVSMVCAMGQIMNRTQEEKNKFDKRMLSTLPGSSFPEDWDNLPEVEKTRRLEGAKEAIK